MTAGTSKVTWACRTQHTSRAPTPPKAGLDRGTVFLVQYSTTQYSQYSIVLQTFGLVIPGGRYLDLMIVPIPCPHSAPRLGRWLPVRCLGRRRGGSRTCTMLDRLPVRLGRFRPWSCMGNRRTENCSSRLHSPPTLRPTLIHTAVSGDECAHYESERCSKTHTCPSWTHKI